MNRDRLRARVRALARRELGLELPDGDLSEHLDSLQRLALVVAIEDEFELCFEPEDEGARTLGDVLDVLILRQVEVDRG